MIEAKQIIISVSEVEIMTVGTRRKPRVCGTSIYIIREPIIWENRARHDVIVDGKLKAF